MSAVERGVGQIETVNLHFHFSVHSHQCPIRDHLFIVGRNDDVPSICENGRNAHLIAQVGLSGFQQRVTALGISELGE